MISGFNWHGSQALSSQEKNEVEEKIKEDFENQITDRFQPCHSGPVSVHLNIVGPLLTDLVGTIRCNCDEPFLIINGTDDGSKINYKTAT